MAQVQPDSVTSEMIQAYAARALDPANAIPGVTNDQIREKLKDIIYHDKPTNFETYPLPQEFIARKLSSPPFPGSPLQSITNFRDVGAVMNHYNGWTFMAEGMLYRGARPDNASFQDRQRLVKDYKIKSIVDLRTKTEHIEQARKRDAKVQSSEIAPQSNDDAAEPLKIPGIKYHEINFNGWGFSRMLISKLSWLQFFQLIGLMIIGRRLDAVKILAPSMEQMGLVGLATESLDACKKEVKQFFEVLSDKANLPVLVHCTQGKDRTGLTVMLVLFLMGAHVQEVEYDYMLSRDELEPEKAERLKEIASIGLSQEFANVPQGLVPKVYEHIQEKYGGINEYLESAGVHKEMRERVRDLLLVPARERCSD